MMKKIYRTFIFIALTAYCSHGLNAQWRKSPGPLVGPITLVKVDARGTAFATSSNQGLFVSTNSGSPQWTYKQYSAITGVGSDGLGRVVMACGEGSIVFSTDGGQSFGGRVYSNAFTDFVFPHDGSILAMDYDGVYKFDNTGNWPHFGTGITGNIDAIVMHPNDHLFVGTADNGILRSTDNGATWDTAGLQQSWVEAMAIDSSGAIFASTEDGRFVRSSDEGKTWTSVKNGFSSAPYYIQNPCAGRNGIAFAVQYNHPGGTTMFATTNSGTIWSPVSGRFRDDTDILSLALAPDGSVLAATNDAGIFRTTDNGATWSAANDGLTDTYISCFGFDAFGGVMAGTLNGVFRSTDQGDSWNLCSKDNQDDIYNLYVSQSDSAVAAVGYNGIYYSTDLGKTWFLSTTSNDPATKGIWRGVDLTSEGAILCGSDSIYRSTNGGNSWKGTYGEQQFDPQLFATARDGTIYCASEFVSSIHHSTDDGLSWAEDTLLRYNNFGSLICDRSGDILLGATGTLSNSTIFRSTDNGVSWLRYMNGEHRLYDIHEDSTSILYAGCDTGAFRSIDHGATWEDISDGLGGASIGIYAIGAGPTGTVFAAGGPRGYSMYFDDYAVYRWSGSEGSVSEVPSNISPKIDAAWPNPSRDQASVHFSLPANAYIHLALYDLLGTERRVIVVGTFASGENTASFDCRGLPEGTYMLCLRTEGSTCSSPLVIQR